MGDGTIRAASATPSRAAPITLTCARRCMSGSKPIGAPAAAAIGRSPEECLPPQVAADTLVDWRDCLRLRHTHRVTFRSEPPGIIRDWEAAIVPVFDETGTIRRLVSIGRDITQRNAAEANRREAHRAEAVGQLTAGIAHDFNNLLQAIGAGLDLLAEQRMASGDTRHFEPLYESIQHLRHLNKSLLLLHKIENKQFGERSSIAVDKILKKMVAHYEDMIMHHKHVLQQGRVEEVVLEGNEVLFQVLLSNLLSNAVYHNIPGGILQIQLERTGLTISNSGEPLPFAEAELFVRFKKHASLSKRAGVGLGLAIVKEICDKYRWSIHYRYADSLHCFNISFTEN